MGGNFYDSMKNPTNPLFWGCWVFCCISFLNMQDESSWIIHELDPLLLREISLFGKSVPGCEVSADSTSDGCFLLCVKMHQIPIVGGKVFSIHSAPSPRLSPPQQASLLFPPLTECSSSLIWAPLSSHFSLHCVGSADTGEKNIIFSSLQLPVKSFLCFCAVYLHSASAELGREGWETTKHIRPNYSASIRAFLSCLGYSLLTVRAVWLTRCADFKAVAQHRVNASNPNPSSFRQSGPNGLP